MYNGEIIDTHMHLWDLKNNYFWLNTAIPELEKMMGDYEQLRHNFLVPDYLAMTTNQKIAKSVHIEAFGFPTDPTLETQWLQKQADQSDFPDGIIGHANLSDPKIEEVLKQHCQYENIRGIRMPLNYHETPYLRMTDREDYMRDAQWQNGLSLLSKYNLLFELQIYDHQIEDAVVIAKMFPETTFVLEHMGWPTAFTGHDFELWLKRLALIAACPNVVIKLSGIGVVFQHEHVDKFNYYITNAVNIFGIDRCMFGSNCPPDSLFHSYDAIVYLVKQALVIYPLEDQKKVFYQNAEKIYRL